MNEQLNITKIGKFISQLRKENQYTQSHLGSILGVTNKAVSKWECGLSCPDISLLPVISKTFDVTLDEIINGERNNNVHLETPAVEEVINKTMEYTKKIYDTKRRNTTIFFLLSLTAIISIICLTINIIYEDTINWALYPIGAMLLVAIPSTLFLLTNTHKLERTFLSLFICLSAYLYLIENMVTLSGWFLSLALPIAFICCVFFYIVSKSIVRYRDNLFLIIGISLLALSVGPLFLINIIVRMNGIERTEDISQIIGLPAALILSLIAFLLSYKFKRTHN